MSNSVTAFNPQSNGSQGTIDPRTNSPLAAAANIPPPQQQGGAPGVIAWVAAWLILIVGLYALSRTKAGKTIVYYVLWLAVVFLLITHAGEIQGIFTQGNIFQGQV